MGGKLRNQPYRNCENALAPTIIGHNRVGFTGCQRTRSGGRRGFQPPHKANYINAGFRAYPQIVAPLSRAAVVQVSRPALIASGSLEAPSTAGQETGATNFAIYG